MRTKKIKTDIINNRVKEHKKYKLQLLKLIDEMPNVSQEGVSKSDWSLPKNHPRKYLDLFYSKVIKAPMNIMKDYFEAKNWDISNGWFQQYEKNSYHSWHNHPNANWTNVYFLELPDKTFKTKIKVQGKILNYEAEEGDLISFPAYLPHTSNKNQGGRKTIIAFNSNFDCGKLGIDEN